MNFEHFASELVKLRQRELMNLHRQKPKYFVISCGFEPHYIPVDAVDCYFKSELDLKKMVMMHHFGQEVYCFRREPPKWNGERYVWERCFLSHHMNDWNYFIQTPLHCVANIFMSDIVIEDMRITESTNEDTRLMFANMEWLKSNSFVSKRTNPYKAVSTADINKIISKLKQMTT